MLLLLLLLLHTELDTYLLAYMYVHMAIHTNPLPRRSAGCTEFDRRTLWLIPQSTGRRVADGGTTPSANRCLRLQSGATVAAI